MIKAYTRSKNARDEISEVLGSPYYAQNWQPKGLRDAILGPHSTQLVTITRHYLQRDPQVAVDFEPSPLEGKFYADEKRSFLIAHGIVYVPVFLGETLSKEQFAKRVQQEEGVMRLGRQAARENLGLKRVDIEDLLISPDVIEAIDTEAMRRVEARIKESPGHVVGIARTKMLVKTKQQIVDELRQKARNGRLGHLFSSQQLALLAR